MRDSPRGGQESVANRRLDVLEDKLNRRPAVTTSNRDMVVKTTTLNVYPSLAQCYYYAEIQRVSGQETEGGAGIFAATGKFCYVFNIGNALIPLGTYVIATQCAGRNIVNFNG